MVCHTRDRQIGQLHQDHDTEAINHDPAVTFFQTRPTPAGPTEYRLLAVLRIGKREPDLRPSCHGFAVPA